MALVNLQLFIWVGVGVVIAAAVIGGRTAEAGNFYSDVAILWGAQNAHISNTGDILTLSLDNTTGSAFESREAFMYASVTAQIKLVPNNSAGTVAAFYVRRRCCPSQQDMNVIGSMWDGDTWATEGGRIRTNWTAAPFTVTFTNYNADGCVVWWSGDITTCNAAASNPSNPAAQPWMFQKLSATGLAAMQQFQSQYTVYNYCTDRARFPNGFPKECSLPA